MLKDTKTFSRAAGEQQIQVIVWLSAGFVRLYVRDPHEKARWWRKMYESFLKVGSSVLKCQLTFTFIFIVYFKKEQFVKYGQNLKAAFQPLLSATYP